MTKGIACRRVIAVLFSAFLLSHCGGQIINEAQSEASSASESGAISNLPAVGGQIQELALDGNDLTLDLEIEDNENAVLLLVGLEGSGATQGFQLGMGGQRKSLSRHLTSEDSQEPESDDLTDAMHDELRAREIEIPDNAPVASPDRYRLARKSPLGNQLNGSATRSFKVLTSFSTENAFTEVTAELAYNGASFDIYVDVRDIPSFSSGDLERVANGFADRLGDEGNLFGPAPDVDGNYRFSVLLTREINALGESYGGLITGYFYATDLFDASLYPSSNESEIIYAMVPNPNGQLGSVKVSYELYMNNILPGVLPHEYQHMANFNAHRFLNATGPEASWLNEGLSHLAEDIYSIDETGFMAFSGVENPSRVASYLKSIDKTCFTCGSSLAQRGGAYLFLRYLYEQAEAGFVEGAENGTDFLWSLTSGAHRDVRNVANALSGDPSDLAAFRDAMAHFGLAVYLSGSEQSHDDIYEINGLDLRAPQDDHRDTVLKGPAVLTADGLSLTETLSGYSLAYVQIPGSVLNAADGRLDLKVADGDKFKAYLIR